MNDFLFLFSHRYRRNMEGQEEVKVRDGIPATSVSPYESLQELDSLEKDNHPSNHDDDESREPCMLPCVVANPDSSQDTSIVSRSACSCIVGNGRSRLHRGTAFVFSYSSSRGTWMSSVWENARDSFQYTHLDISCGRVKRWSNLYL